VNARVEIWSRACVRFEDKQEARMYPERRYNRNDDRARDDGGRFASRRDGFEQRDWSRADYGRDYGRDFLDNAGRSDEDRYSLMYGGSADDRGDGRREDWDRSYNDRGREDADNRRYQSRDYREPYGRDDGDRRGVATYDRMGYDRVAYDRMGYDRDRSGYGDRGYGYGYAGRGDYGRGDYGRGDYGRGDYGRGDRMRADYGRGDYGTYDSYDYNSYSRDRASDYDRPPGGRPGYGTYGAMSGRGRGGYESARRQDRDEYGRFAGTDDRNERGRGDTNRSGYGRGRY
jgi:hypothetical protein